MKCKIICLFFAIFAVCDAYSQCRTVVGGWVEAHAGNKTIDLSNLVNGQVTQVRHEISYQGLYQVICLGRRDMGIAHYHEDNAEYRVGKVNVRVKTSHRIDGLQDVSNIGGAYVYKNLRYTIILDFSLASGVGERPPLNPGRFELGILSSDFQNRPKPLVPTPRDIFLFDVMLTYDVKPTTCYLSDTRPVVLPEVSIYHLLSSARAGYTPFRLNIECEHIAFGRSDRKINMYLYTSDMWHSDRTVLVDSSPGAAQGVGIRLVDQRKREIPVVFSNVGGWRPSYNSTSIFNVSKEESLDNNFSIDMAAYYHVFNKQAVTAGRVRVGAALQIVYD